MALLRDERPLEKPTPLITCNASVIFANNRGIEAAGY
jgi:hypothetical protein